MRLWLTRIATPVAGLAVSGMPIFVVQTLRARFYTPPFGVALTDPAAMATFTRQLPIGALLVVELLYIVGSLAGGVTVRLISRDRAYLLAAPVEEGGGLLPTGPREERLLPVHVDYRRPAPGH